MVDQRQAMNNGAGRPRAVGYIRPDDDGRTTHMTAEAQRDEIRQMCERSAWALVGTYEDNGAVNERPALEQVMADARDRNFDVMVIHSSDMLSHAVTVVLHRLSELGIEVHSLTEGEISLDDGNLRTTLMEALRKMHLEFLSDRVRRGIRFRRSRGLHWGALPVGYQLCDTSCPTGGGHSYCHPVTEQADRVREAFGRYAAGCYSMTAIADWLNEQGLRTNGGNAFTARSVRAILAKPLLRRFRQGS